MNFRIEFVETRGEILFLLRQDSFQVFDSALLLTEPVEQHGVRRLVAHGIHFALLIAHQVHTALPPVAACVRESAMIA